MTNCYTEIILVTNLQYTVVLVQDVMLLLSMFMHLVSLIMSSPETLISTLLIWITSIHTNSLTFQYLFPQMNQSPDFGMTDQENGAQEGWRCVMGINGELFASGVGIWRMLQWFAESSTVALCWMSRMELGSDVPAAMCCGGM